MTHRADGQKRFILETTGLVRSFGSMNAVDGVNLSVEQGRITGLIGPNGAGKTTLFNLIAGSLAPTRGEIRFRGERIDGHSPNGSSTRGWRAPSRFAALSADDGA